VHVRRCVQIAAQVLFSANALMKMLTSLSLSLFFFAFFNENIIL
jgi:hypothetical protein